MEDMTTRHDDLRTTPRLGRYRIDTDGSTVTLRGRHLFGLLPVRGTVAVRTGTVEVAEPLAESAVYAEIETASFHTSNEHRDHDVRSARFLDADLHPVMTFRSAAVDAATVSGSLTVCGVDRQMTLSLVLTDVSPGAFAVRARTRIDRTDFGVTAARGLAGRFIDVTMEVRCIRA